MLKAFVALCLCLGTVKGGADKKWDRLVLTFPQFNNMPTNEIQATNANWTKDSDCDEHNVFVGNRYNFKGDKSTRLIFGKDGITAGIQVTLSPTSTYPTFSSPSPWIKVSDNEAIVTVYFRNPHTICKSSGGKSGKKATTFGHELYLQTKSWLAQGGKKAIRILKNRTELHRKNSLWFEGKCFPKMGMHYWYNVSVNMRCEDIYPTFLLYNVKTNTLKSFGWSVPLRVRSAAWEQPPRQVFGLFFSSENIPSCLASHVVSTQHVYLTDPKELQGEG